MVTFHAIPGQGLMWPPPRIIPGCSTFPKALQQAQWNFVFSVFGEFAIDGGFAGYLRAGSDVTTPENNFLAAPKKHQFRFRHVLARVLCFIISQWNFAFSVLFFYVWKSTIDAGFAGYPRAGSDVTIPQNNFLAALLSQKHCSEASPHMFWQTCFCFNVSQWNRVFSVYVVFLSLMNLP